MNIRTKIFIGKRWKIETTISWCLSVNSREKKNKFSIQYNQNDRINERIKSKKKKNTGKSHIKEENKNRPRRKYRTEPEYNKTFLMKFNFTW